MRKNLMTNIGPAREIIASIMSAINTDLNYLWYSKNLNLMSSLKKK